LDRNDINRKIQITNKKIKR